MLSWAKTTFPVIVNRSLSDVEEEKLLRILWEHKKALGWTIFDIKGISPSNLHTQDFNGG